MSEFAASAAVKSVTGIRDSIHDTLATSPTTNVLEVAVVNEKNPSILKSRKSARNASKKVCLDTSINN